MRVCLGGTFDPLHAGHRALLAAGLDASLLLVGITDDALARRPDRDVAPWEVRAARVAEALDEMGFEGSLETHRLTTPVGPAASGDFDRLVVSEGTRAGADAIQDARRRAGLAPLALRVVPFTLGQDLLPVSATRVHAGDVDAEGGRLTPVRVAVGSANPVKVQAAADELEDALRCAVDARGFAVPSGVPEQPKGDEIMLGARLRAQAAARVWPEAEYAVGVEAGLCQDPSNEQWYDVQACVLLDHRGEESEGWGPAFRYPDWVTRRALGGEMVSDVLGPVAEDPRIGGTTGAVGYLSDGRMDRTRLTRIAITMALVPRIRREVYLTDVWRPTSPSSGPLSR